MSTKKFEPRKIIRLQGYDYSQKDAYFITMCIENGHEILAQIVGDDAHGVPYIKLTEIGEIVKNYIENINYVYSDEVKVPNYIIMPNHIHMIIILYSVQISGNNGNQISGTPWASSPTICAKISCLFSIQIVIKYAPSWE